MAAIMQLWRVFLQHDETARNSEFVVEAKDDKGAEKRAIQKYGKRWFVYDVKPEPEDEDTKI